MARGVFSGSKLRIGHGLSRRGQRKTILLFYSLTAHFANAQLNYVYSILGATDLEPARSNFQFYTNSTLTARSR